MLQHFVRSSNPQQGGIVIAPNNSATPGTTVSVNIRIPSNVTQIAAIAIGGGGGGGGASCAASASAGGGGGGALAYTNVIPVTPGETLAVVVANQSAAGTNTGGNGGNGSATSLSRGACALVKAAGGLGSLGRSSGTASAGAVGGAAACSVGSVKYSGGTGGAGQLCDWGGGGGSAAGYSANGVTGGTSGGAGSNGNGGSGGGGASYTNGIIGGSGGGTLFYGAGSSGNGGVTTSGNCQNALSGHAGSMQTGCTNSRLYCSPNVAANTSNVMGFPGGGGAGAPSGGTTKYYGMRGAGGVLRLVWGQNLDFSNGTNVSNNQLYIRSSATSLTSSISLPGVELGDTAIFIDYADNTSGAPTAVTPTGFTTLLNTTSGTKRLTTYYKQILSSAETGTSLTGANGTSYNAKIIVVVSGKMGASYSPVLNLASGNDNTLNGAISSNVQVASVSYTVNAVDNWANGIPVGFMFISSPAALSTYSSDYKGQLGDPILITTSDSRTQVKIGMYPLTPYLTLYSGTINLAMPVGLNSYAHWYSNFW